MRAETKLSADCRFVAAGVMSCRLLLRVGRRRYQSSSMFLDPRAEAFYRDWRGRRRDIRQRVTFGAMAVLSGCDGVARAK
jgi:hypothetical protein